MEPDFHTEKPAIVQTIVVEGRDDRSAVERAVAAPVLETHGFGIRAEKWAELEAAYARTGLIIFTDPDFSGEKIRARLARRFPQALHAYLTVPEAERNGDIGIENAAPDAIAAALEKAHALVRKSPENGGESSGISALCPFTTEDMLPFSGGAGAAERRRALGSILGIGYSNAAMMRKKLNRMGITREEFEAACEIVLKRPGGADGPSGNRRSCP